MKGVAWKIDRVVASTIDTWGGGNDDRSVNRVSVEKLDEKVGRKFRKEFRGGGRGFPIEISFQVTSHATVFGFDSFKAFGKVESLESLLRASSLSVRM